VNWFGRYMRQLGITNKALLFHSFRHGFKDALRAAGVSEDVNDALTGHAGGGTVGRTYGAKDMLKGSVYQSSTMQYQRSAILALTCRVFVFVS
jgi:integrase